MHRTFQRALPLTLTVGLAGAALAQQPARLDSTSRSYTTGAQITSIAYRPEAQVVVDLNEDGRPDVVNAHDGNFIDPRFSVLLNQGDGSLAPPVAIPTKTETQDVCAADFDGDGHMDVAFAGADLSLGGSDALVFRGKGDGTFHPEQAWPVGLKPAGIVAFDADNDGDVDLATANWDWGENDVSVLYNDGAAGFSQRVDFPLAATGSQQAYALDAGDVDGDGWRDLAVVNRGSNPPVQLLLNDGAGGFLAPVLHGAVPSIIEVPAIHLADVDLDGDLDVLASNGLYRNLGGGALGALETWSWTGLFGFMHSYAVADFTGDGLPDVGATAYASDFGWFLAVNDGTGHFPSHQLFAVGENPRDISAADMDGDGDLEAVVTDGASQLVTVHDNEGGAFSMPPFTETSAFTKESDAADLDLDGDLDLVTMNSSLWILRNDGSGNFQASGTGHGFSILDKPKLADLTGDGYPDLLAVKNLTIGAPPYNLYYARNDGAGGFLPMVSIPLGSCGTGDAEPVDLDGDGDLDVVVTEYLGCPSQDARKLYLLFNDGAGNLAPPVLVKDFTVTGPERVRAGDLDNDGDMDLVTGHPYLVVWLNQGNGTFGVPFVADTAGNAVKYLELADFDGDGNLDVALTGFGSSFAGEALTVMRGYGDGGFRPPQTYLGMFALWVSGLGGLDLLDADQDGDTDIVAGCYAAQDAALWLNQGDGTFGQEVRYGVNGVVSFVTAGDFDGDGLTDVVTNNGTPPPLSSGVSLLRGLDAPAGPQTYCTAKTSSSGCVPSIGFTGSPSPAGGFTLTASQVEAVQLGVAFWSTAGDNNGGAPFQGGFLCVTPPVKRQPVAGSGGSTPCSGSYATPMSAVIAGLPAGTQVYAQYWFRDPGAASGTGLSDALAFTTLP